MVDFLRGAELKYREADCTMGVLATFVSVVQPGQVPKCSQDIDAWCRSSLREGGIDM